MFLSKCSDLVPDPKPYYALWPDEIFTMLPQFSLGKFNIPDHQHPVLPLSQPSNDASENGVTPHAKSSHVCPHHNSLSPEFQSEPSHQDYLLTVCREPIYFIMCGPMLLSGSGDAQEHMDSHNRRYKSLESNTVNTGFMLQGFLSETS